jgi:transcriptional regulator with XRE-family HTH domain
MPIDEATFNRALGRRIRTARKGKGMNQERLAVLLDLGRTSIVMIEKGDQRVHAHLLVNLATALGVPVNDLLGLREATPSPPTATGLPQAEEARAWVMAGLTQSIVITADGDNEEEDRGDESKDQG